jgi:hypothetical protein
MAADVPAIVDDALSNGMFGGLSAADIDDEIQAAMMARETHAIAYVHQI